MKFFYPRQHTVTREVWCGGVGLHTGADVTIRLKPAPPDFGIRFQRADLTGKPVITAHYRQVVDTFQATTIGIGGAVVGTVEHLMAAFFGCGVDNVLVEVDGPEIPILDGSAAPYTGLIRKAGIREQDAVRKCLIVDRPLVVKEDGAYIRVTPSDHFRIDCAIDFPHPLVGKQRYSWSFCEDSFKREIAKARTFGFLKDVRKLQTMGRAQGGSLANAIVLDECGLLNREGFRYADECVRHKLLDFMGDLALIGMPVVGAFQVHRAGHSLHSRFLKQLMTRPGTCSLAQPSCIPTGVFPASRLPAFAGQISSVAKPI